MTEYEPRPAVEFLPSIRQHPYVQELEERLRLACEPCAECGHCDWRDLDDCLDGMAKGWAATTSGAGPTAATRAQTAPEHDPLTEEGGVNESSSGVHGQQMSPLRSPENDRSGRSSASTSPPAASGSPCPRCDGDGYVESFNADHSDVVITLCPDCGPGPGYHDG